MTVQRIAVWGAKTSQLSRWIDGLWAVCDGNEVVAWFKNEADARRFARG